MGSSALVLFLALVTTVPAPTQVERFLGPRQHVDGETAARLAVEFQPPEVTEIFRLAGDEHSLENPVYQMNARRDECFSFNMGYKQLDIEGEERCLVILYWLTNLGRLYWVLLESDDGVVFELLQKPDSSYISGVISLRNPWFTTMDLDRDGVSEVLLMTGNCWNRVEALYVFRWNGNGLELISPTKLSPNRPVPNHETEIISTFSHLSIQNVDDDGPLEVVAYPNMIHADTRVFCMRDGVYVLCDTQLPGQEPRVVRGIAAIHPGTLTLARLESAGTGELRLFVGTPAGDDLTADDFDPDSFVHKLSDTPLAFKKRWPNKQYPDRSFTSIALEGIPYRAVERSGQGEWELNPSAPAVPGSDKGEAFAFVGPYLELRMPLASAAPRLQAQAERFFKEHPDQDRAWVTLTLAARMKDGTRASVVAVVRVKRTGED